MAKICPFISGSSLQPCIEDKCQFWEKLEGRSVSGSCKLILGIIELSGKLTNIIETLREIINQFEKSNREFEKFNGELTNIIKAIEGLKISILHKKT